MAKSKSLTVLTVMSSIFALQACSEGITSAEEALSNLSNQTSAEATDPAAISIGAANPTGIETTIPVTPSVISNYIVNNISVLPFSSSSPDEELAPGLAPETDTPPKTDFEVVTDTASETDFEVVTDTASETDSEVVTDTASETDSEVVTDTTTDTDSEIVTDIAPETEEKEIANVDYTPILEAPTEGEIVPFGSTIQFAWSIPVALFGTVTGFDISIADASEGVVSYRDNGVSMSSCSDDGLCTHEINSADLPIPEGDNIWSVSSLGDDVSSNIAAATFTLDKNPEEMIAPGFSLLSPAVDFIADSSSVDFAWEDASKPEAVYDLHVYSDAARTQKVTGTNGVIFDTNGIGTATSHTLTDDPSDGAKRYGLLWQWSDAAYDPDFRQEILFEYTAHTKVNAKVVSPVTEAGYDIVKLMVDAEWADAPSWYTGTLTSSDLYYGSPILHASGMLSRVTGNRDYLDVGIRIGQNYIDSGVDRNRDAILDWMGTDNGITDYNIYHHEWRAGMGIASVLIEMQRTGYTDDRASRIAEWHQFLKVHVWEKWLPGHSQTNPSGAYMSNTTSQTTWFVGRLALINMALDKTHATPGNNEYHTWLTSKSTTFGKMFGTYIGMIESGDWQFPTWSDNGRPNIAGDTNHINDAVFPILLGKIMGYTFVGSNDLFFDKMEAHLNYNWFPTSVGFQAYSNGTGKVNQWQLSGSSGLALTAGLSPSLKARYVDMFFNYEPANGFYERSRYNQAYAVLQGANLMWVLAGGTL